MTSTTDDTEHERFARVEDFDCTHCAFRGVVEIDALAVVTAAALAPSSERQRLLAERLERGDLSIEHEAALRALRRSLAGEHGDAPGISAEPSDAEATTPSAAAQRARWLADTARCPHCGRLRAGRIGPHLRSALVHRAAALGVWVFAGSWLGFVYCLLESSFAPLHAPTSQPLFAPRPLLVGAFALGLAGVFWHALAVRRQYRAQHALERRVRERGGASAGRATEAALVTVVAIAARALP